eukprot:CAMPEP_0185032814 /NCGR_PEP_ID=MMETSP1103-20130426/21260_1 /TAXON_ID=36769 /ORGANISM="Paraphysomonas bandaiensis, Strain Caron Lab Isolate" /LENGTH=686 /DNA_ID=CAMNT_0027568851 /DNA_START=137 /DNA_END=2197 /DNA_ORIENTATION=-
MNVTEDDVKYHMSRIECGGKGPDVESKTVSIRNIAIQQLSHNMETNRVESKSGSLSVALPGAHNKRDTGCQESVDIDESCVKCSHSISEPPAARCTVSTGNIRSRKKRPALKIDVLEDQENTNGCISFGKQESSYVTEGYRLTPGGSVQVGDFRINETGIEVSDMSHAPSSFLTGCRSDFVPIGKLGTGNSGSVIEAFHVPTLTVVALKMIPVHEKKNLEHIASELSVLYRNLAQLRLIDERLDSTTIGEEYWDSETDAATSSSTSHLRRRRTVAKSQSSGIVSCCPQLLAMYDAFLDSSNGMVNLVVEYMDGGSLQDVVDNGGCRDEEVIADIAYQVLLGLDFLHSQNQMHRDIKPGNIMLNCSGQVKVADFGISTALDSGVVSENSFVGTIAYMAPERILNREYDCVSDVWSFGLTLLAVVLARYPLQSASQKAPTDYWDMQRLICDELTPEPGDIFSEEFNMLINKCLDKDPSRRARVRELMLHPFFRLHQSVMRDNDDHVVCYDASEICDKVSTLLARHEDKNGISTRQSTASTASSGIFSGLSRLSSLTATRLSTPANEHNDSVASCHSEWDEDIVVVNVRKEHLERLFLKTSDKYDNIVQAWLKRRAKYTNADKREISSWSYRQSSAAKKVSDIEHISRLPNFVSGRSKWLHLAQQLHLPLDMVMSTAEKLVDKKYFVKE